MSDIFRLFDIFHRGSLTKNNWLLIKKNLIFWFFRFLTYPHWSHFCFLVPICILGKNIGGLYKYNQSKISTITLKKPFLSSSAAHTSYAINSTRTSISSQLDNKDMTTNQNKNNTSNIYDIHSFIQNIILYCKNIIKSITKNILSWCKIK